MTVENGVRVIASSVVLLSVAMSHPKCTLYVSDKLLWVATFVGVMMFQSAFTGFCPAGTILKKLGMKSAA